MQRLAITRLPLARTPPPSVSTPCDSVDRPLYFSPVFPVGLPVGELRAEFCPQWEPNPHLPSSSGVSRPLVARSRQTWELFFPPSRSHLSRRPLFCTLSTQQECCQFSGLRQLADCGIGLCLENAEGATRYWELVRRKVALDLGAKWLTLSRGFAFEPSE